MGRKILPNGFRNVMCTENHTGKGKTKLYQRISVHLLIFIALGFLAYSNTFTVPFVLDDEPYIVRNPAVKDLNYFREPSKMEAVKTIKPNFRNAFRTRTVGYLTFALNYRLHGLDVTGYHVVNLLIHLFNALLVYALVIHTYRTPFVSPDRLMKRHSETSADPLMAAFFTALFFLCHPIQTQAVTYIAQRFTSLATFFYLLSLVAYVKFKLSESTTGRYGLYLVSMLSAILGMLTKEICFTLPVVMGVYEFMFFDGKVIPRIFFLSPFILAAIVIPLRLLGVEVLTTDKEAIDGMMRLFGGGSILPRWDYFLTQIRVVVTYMRLIFFPVNQNIDYDYPVYHSLANASLFLSIIFHLFILGLGGFLFWRSKNTRSETRGELRLIAFGILWFFVALSVESSVIPLADIIFEHRIYLPSIGAFISIVAAMLAFKRKLTVKMPAIGRVIIPALGIAVVALLFATYVRNGFWGDDVTLWNDAIEKSPQKARPYNMLGIAYFKTDRLDEAIREYKNAIRLKPDYFDAHNNLGLAYLKQGRTEEGTRELKAAYAKGHYDLGLRYIAQRRLEEAIREFQVAIEGMPHYAEAHIKLGLVFGEKGRFEEAIREFQTAISLKPEDGQVYFYLGRAYGELDRLDEALKELETAARLMPKDADTQYNLGVIYRFQGRWEEARARFRMAIELDTNYKKVIENLETEKRKTGK